MTPSERDAVLDQLDCVAAEVRELRLWTDEADSDARVDQDRTAAPHQHTRLGQQHYYAQDDRGRSR